MFTIASVNTRTTRRERADTHVQLMELQVLVVTGIVWQSAAPATVPQVPPSAGFSAVAQLQQVLEAEGDEAKVFVYATFTDGMTQQVATSEVDLSANCSSVTVANGTASQPASLTVVEGATAYVGSAVAAVWRVGGETLGLGFGWANVSMPTAVLVWMVVIDSTVAVEWAGGAPCHHTPFAPSSLSLPRAPPPTTTVRRCGQAPSRACKGW